MADRLIVNGVQLRILLIEDDITLGAEMKAAIEKYGFIVDLAVDRWSGESAAMAQSYALVLLDLNLPDGNGLQTLSFLRKRNSGIPVIAVTAIDDRDVVVKALNLGADDYVRKPFDLDELAARMRAAIRRSEGRAENRLRAGRIEIDETAASTSFEGSPLQLTRREYAVLRLLVQRAGRFVPREHIEAEVYDDNTEVQSNTIEAIIYNLRRKLGPGIVHTSRGLGYSVAP